MKIITYFKTMLMVMLVLLLGTWTAAFGQTITSTATGGLWNVTTTWSGGVVPGSTNDVVIADGATVTFNNGSSVTVASLTIGQGNTGILTFDGVAAQAVVVTGNVTVAAGGSFIVQSSGTFTNTLSIGGDLTNNGTFDMSRGGSTLICNVTFTKAGDQNIGTTGTPALTCFRIITLSKTALANRVVCSIDVSFAGAIVWTAGTWEQTAGTLSCTSTDQTLAINGALIFSGGGGYSSTGSSLLVSGGALTINTSGTVVVGLLANSNNNLQITSGTLTIQKGTINIFGFFKNSGGTTTISENGGAGTTNINIKNLSPGNNSFDVPGASAGFTMSGGTITIVDPLSSGTTAIVDMYMNTIATITITGGTIVIGDGVSTNTGIAGSKGFFINTHTVPLWNLVINAGSTAGRQVTLGNKASMPAPRNLVVKNNLSITSGTLNANVLTKTSAGSNITIGGAFTNSGTFNGGASSVYTFNGSSAQTTGALPSFVPSLIISNTAGVSLSSNTTPTTLTNSASSILNVPAGKQLTVYTTLTNNGALNLLSDATGTATILTPATLSGTGTYSVQQYLTGKTGDATTDNWWYISSPVTGATSAIFDPASIATDKNLFGYYNEPTVAYPQITTNDVPLTAGTGYVVKLGGVAGSNAIYTFTGTLNDGDIPVTVTRTGTDAGKRGFNLVGNPYPSYLDWNALQTASNTAASNTNVRPTIWYRTRTSGGAMQFDTFDGTIGTDNGVNGTVTQYIPPLQAFWMKVDADNSSATLTFANNMRSHKAQSITANRLRAANVNSAQIVRLKVSNGINGDEALIVADPNALDGFDNYDSQKMTNGDVNIPEIFTLAGSEELVINHVNSISANKELNLGFRPGKTGDFTIEATEISNLDNNLKVMLLDKLTNTQQEIKVGSPYSFSSDATATNNRFSVLFKASSSPTGLENPSSNGDVTVYRNTANHVTVVCNANVNEKSLVSVYNAVGQRLIQQKLTGKVTEINDTFMPGIYIVSVNNGGQSVTKKIIIN